MRPPRPAGHCRCGRWYSTCDRTAACRHKPDRPAPGPEPEIAVLLATCPVNRAEELRRHLHAEARRRGVVIDLAYDGEALRLVSTCPEATLRGILYACT